MTVSNPNREVPALEIKKLSKKYAGRAVLDKIDLLLPPAALVGLLGPNGAGKTTLIKSLAGLITPDSGQIKIAGYDLHKQEAAARGQLAYVPDVPHFYVEMTVLEHLEFVARAFKAWQNFEVQSENLLRRFGLWEVRHNPPFTLSRGMTQKLALCCAFIRPSKVLLLDEPGGTLDIKSVAELYKLLDEYRQHGGLAVFSSHQWETLQNLCDLFVLVDQGQVVASGSLEFLCQEASLPLEASLREIYMTYMYESEAVSDVQVASTDSDGYATLNGEE